jgi:hypothetical protein
LSPVERHQKQLFRAINVQKTQEVFEATITSLRHRGKKPPICLYRIFYLFCELKTGIIPIFSSRMSKIDFILGLYNDQRTIFRLADAAMLYPELATEYLSDRMGYYVKTGRLIKLRHGIYAKPNYNPLELANRLFTPSYLSLEFVLQQAGVVFQYGSRFTCISYLSREVVIDGRTYSYRSMRKDLIMAPGGLIRHEQGYTIATPERAFLDLMYLNKDFYVDNIQPLNQAVINALLPAYQTQALEKRVFKLLNDGGQQ